MNNEYINSWISKLSPVILADIFKLYNKFLSTLQTRNHEVNCQIFYSARFSLEWQKQLSLISIHTFHLSLTLFFVKEKYLGRKINFHFLRVPAKNCCKRKLIWSSIILVLRIYWGLSSFRPDKAVGWTFCKNFLTLVKFPRDSRKKSDWFRCKKISQKLKYLNFKCEQSERFFSSYSIRFTTLHMSHAQNFSGEKRKAWVEIRLNVVEEFSAERQRAVISWDHYLTI